jgi:hypothetical protein
VPHRAQRLSIDPIRVDWFPHYFARPVPRPHGQRMSRSLAEGPTSHIRPGNATLRQRCSDPRRARAEDIQALPAGGLHRAAYPLPAGRPEPQ